MTPYPKYLQIEPVGQCNLRCTMCAIQFRQDGPPYGPVAFMDFGDFTRLIDQFTGLEVLHLQGLGEPMMHPRFFDMVRYAVDKGIRVTTNSNLTLLNQRRAELCVTSGLDTLHVSLDGATAETFERIRVRGHFDRVIRNIELVSAAIAAAKAAGGMGLPHLHMVMVIMRQNLHELPDLVALGQRLGMEEIFVQHLSHDFKESSLPEHYRPMRDYVDEQTLLTEDPARVEHYFAAARQVSQQTGVKLRLPRLKWREYAAGTPGRDRCDWPWTGGYISYDGHAMPCCMVSTPDRANMGNMVEQGVEAIWNGPVYEQFRAELASGEAPEVCRSCALYHGTF
jgi:radical SAM protein with 4Fe4S-binding SPASM domain